jgi:tRNA threonylcarbamoyladenosine biosynthesis protein TsaE
LNGAGQANRWRSVAPEDTRRIGAALAAELLPDGVLLVEGDLGAGKTVLAQGVASGLGIAAEEVQSPTYTLVREHRGDRVRLLHLDLYRLDADDVAAAGIEETLAETGVKIVEWPDRLAAVPRGAVSLRITLLPNGERDIERLAR